MGRESGIPKERILDVKYSSQHKKVKDIYKDRACGITCLRMLLGYYANEREWVIPSVNDLCVEMHAIGGFCEQGSKHASLVTLAHNHGLYGYAEEFKSRDPKMEKCLASGGIAKISEWVSNGRPVIASIVNGAGSHLILLVGLRTNGNNVLGFYYHDPNAKIGEKSKKNCFFDLGDFSQKWRKAAIFIADRQV